MHERDWNLLDLVRLSLGLRGRVYHNRPYHYDRYGSRNSAAQASLVVRDILDLRNIIIPLFTKSYTAIKVNSLWNGWKMGDEEMTTESKYLHKLYKSGYLIKKIF